MATQQHATDFTLDTASELAAEEHEVSIVGRSPWYLAWRRLRRNKVALASFLLFVLIVIACALAPVYAKRVAKTGPNENHVTDVVTVGDKKVDVLSRGGMYVDPETGELKLKVIDPEIYFTTIGNQKTRAQTGVANWFQDYPHPLNWFDVLLNGNRITETHNNNYSNANVPEINRRIEQLKRESELTDDVNNQWAEVDRLVAENSFWAPYVNRHFTDFFSEEMDVESCFVNHVLMQLDYAQVCTKA